MDDTYGAVVAVLNAKLRVIRGNCGLQWIAQTRGPKTWRCFSFCATREGLLVRISDHLLKAHLSRLGYYEATDRRLLKKAAAATETARAQLRRGNVSGFGVDPGAWAVIMVLPEHCSAFSQN